MSKGQADRSDRFAVRAASVSAGMVWDDSIAATQRRGQHLGQRGDHLNLAIMSLMPGIVSI